MKKESKICNIKFPILLCIFLIANIFGYSANYKYKSYRKEKIPMFELTNPESYYYVLIPYPKTKKEVIKNLEYRYRKQKEKRRRKGDRIYYSSYKRKNFISRLINHIKYFLYFGHFDRRPKYYYDPLDMLFIKEQKFIAGKMVFVKDYSILKNLKDKKSKEYYTDRFQYILLDILNTKGQVMSRITFSQNGRFRSCSYKSSMESTGHLPLIDIKKKLLYLKKQINEPVDVIGCEYVFYHKGHSDSQYPFIKITTKKNKKYYYQLQKEKMFKEIGRVDAFSEDFDYMTSQKPLIYSGDTNEYIFLKLVNSK